MTRVAPPPTSPPIKQLPLGHLVFESVTWAFFERTLRECDRSGQRFRYTFDRGRFELMTPGPEHELDKTLLARLVELYALERDVPITGAGSIDLKSKRIKKGLLPDECYYVNAPVPPRTRSHVDLTQHAPPDLAIEVEVSRTVVKRLPVYRALKVGEVWRLRRGKLNILVRGARGGYRRSATSVAFPRLTPEIVGRFLALATTTSQHECVKAFQRWLRENPND